MFNWSGFYAGVNAGYEKTRSSGTDYLLDSSTQEKASGVVGGFQLGYLYQTGRAVLGTEVSFAAGNMTANSDCSAIPIGPDISCRLKEKWNGRVVAKLGYASEDGRFLPYLLGGVAMAELDSDRALTGGGMFLLGWGSSRIYTGLTGGFGFQYAWTQNLSFGAEYLFTQYGMQKPVFEISGINGAFTQNVRSETLRLVMNYRFAGPLGR